MLAVVILTSFGVACENDNGKSDGKPQINELEVWAHTGQMDERKTLEKQVKRFNESQGDVRIDLTILPEGSYNAQVQAAALAGDFPDILEFDGPFIYNYVWQGHLVPIDDLITGETKNNLLPSIIHQGEYQGHLYSIGTFDSGLGLYGRKSVLERAGIRIPGTPADAWSAGEFEKLLKILAEDDDDGAILDLKFNYRGEWYTYAFSPIIQSAGGDLVDRTDYQTADGVLNGAEAVSAMRELQSWIKKGYVDPNIDDAAFIEGRAALSWAGHWEYHRYVEAFGDDLLILPLPDFGKGSRSGQGSWNWGITTNCSNTRAAMRFLEFLLQPDEVLAMTNANGAVPATYSAIKLSPLYGKQGPLTLFVEQLESTAVPRPQTPAYPVITSAFQNAFADIRNGADVKLSLNRAVAIIDRDIRDNKGYPQQP